MSTIRIDITSDKVYSGKTSIAAAIARVLVEEGIEDVVVNCLDGDIEKHAHPPGSVTLGEKFREQPKVVINDMNGVSSTYPHSVVRFDAKSLVSKSET